MASVAASGRGVAVLPAVEPAPASAPKPRKARRSSNCVRYAWRELDPTALAKLTPERADPGSRACCCPTSPRKRRIQLNAREQRTARRASWSTTCSGSDRWNPCSKTTRSPTSWSTGRIACLSSAAASSTLSGVRFRDAAHRGACLPAHRRGGRPTYRRDRARWWTRGLKDGSRVNIVFPPLALDGPYISIRKFARQPIDFARLIEFGTMTPPVAHVLEIAARCRLNVIISGGTGSGKTTLLNALSRLIDHRRTHRHDRGRRGTATAAAARGATGNPPAPASKGAARSPSATWSATHCACAQTASSSARSAAPRRSTCCRQ